MRKHHEDVQAIYFTQQISKEEKTMINKKISEKDQETEQEKLFREELVRSAVEEESINGETQSKSARVTRKGFNVFR